MIQLLQLHNTKLVIYSVSILNHLTTDAEIVKECFINASYVLFDKCNNKNKLKLKIKSDIKTMQLSDSTCIRRIENIAKYL